MIAERRLRFGIVGAGAIAQTYAQALRDSELAEAVAVADLRLDAAQAIGETLRCQSFPSHAAMADRVQLDACVVCTPPAAHPPVCIDLVRRGIHVLCEKPLAIDPASARRMIAEAGAAGVILMMASKFRYVADVVQAKSLVASGLIGNVVCVENSFTAFVDMSSRWNAVPAISGGGVLIDNATHSLDIMRYFLGPLTEIQAVEGQRIQSLPVEDTVLIWIRSARGTLGSIDVSWSLSKRQADYLRIYGSNGTVLVGWKESKYLRSSDLDWVVFGHGYDKLRAFRGQLENFCRAIRGVESPLIAPHDALASVLVVEAAYRAVRCGAWQPVEDIGSAGDGATLPAGAQT